MVRPWLSLLAKTGLAPTISPASASVIASFNLPGTASPPWVFGAREIRAFVRFVQGFRRAWERAPKSELASGVNLLGGDCRPRELAAGESRDRVLLAQERDADRPA